MDIVKEAQGIVNKKADRDQWEFNYISHVIVLAHNYLKNGVKPSLEQIKATRSLADKVIELSSVEE